MAKTFYVPVNEESVKPTKWYVPADGESTKVVKAYCSDNGSSKLFWGDSGDGYNYKKVTHDPDPYVSSLFTLPLTVTENTTYTAAWNLADESGVTPYLFTIDARITSNQSKVYMVLTHSPAHPTYGKEYFICYVSQNPFTYEEYQTNGKTGQSTTFSASSIAKTMNNITYHASARWIGYENGGANYHHKYASSSFDINKSSQASVSYSETQMWYAAYIVFTGTIQNY